MDVKSEANVGGVGATYDASATKLDGTCSILIGVTERKAIGGGRWCVHVRYADAQRDIYR